MSNHIFIQQKYWIVYRASFILSCLIKDSRHNINVACEKQLLFLTTTCIPISNPFLNIKLRCWINLSNLFLFNKWKIAIAIYNLSYFFLLNYFFLLIIILSRLRFSLISYIHLFTFHSISIIVIMVKTFPHSIGRRPLRSKCIIRYSFAGVSSYSCNFRRWANN